MIDTFAQFVRDVGRSITWRTLLLVQLLAAAIEIIAVLSFVMPLQPPATFAWSRVVIEEVMAFGIVFALLAANQAIARGAPAILAYAVAIVVASLCSAVLQFELRHWLGLYTNGDRPDVPMSVRRMQMIYAFSDALTYGVLVMLMYIDYLRRDRLVRRVRRAQLEHARHEQHLHHTRLAALRSHVDAEVLVARLADVQHLFEEDSPEADERLDQVIAGLRDKLGQSEPLGEPEPA